MIRFAISRGHYAVSALIAGVILLTGSAPARSPRVGQSGACEPPGGNPIVCENMLPGSPASEWDVSGAGDPEIQGFTTDLSVNRGETVQFKVKSSTAYQLDIYRMGYYDGLGARRVATIPSSATTAPAQPACLTDTATGLVDCGNWSVTASWPVPATAVSGIYFAKATRTGGGSSHIVFVVRDDDGRSDILFQTADTTWQAYNRYGGNSLYTGSPDGRAYKVSYNRPFTTRGATPEDWVFHAEYPMVRWLESNGYNVSYFTGIDSDRLGAEIREHRVFLSVGHDEYWSAAQRTHVESARNAGVHLAFFSGNEVFWKTRWEPSIATGAAPYRTLVCYKETHANAKIDPMPNTWTGTWRDARFSPPADGGRPENALTGTMFTVNAGSAAIEVPAAEGRLRFWRNTAAATLAPGAALLLPYHTLGYEWDEDYDNGVRPHGLMRLSDTTVLGVQVLVDNGSTYGTGNANHALTLYKHPSGALVFGAGTIQWSWGLDSSHDGAQTSTSRDMQQATLNLLADMGVQPITPRPDLVTSAASTDVLAPTSTIASPMDGSSVPAFSTVTISGTASDAGGGLVGGVEVSVDGGVTWRRASGRSNWTYTWQTGAARTAQVFSRAVDDSGNLEQPATGHTVTVGGSTNACPCSLWSSGQVPAVVTDADPQAVELGMRFRAGVNGYISAIRFYKGPQNTGPHQGHLWSSTGTLLGSVTFTNVTSSGWQQASLPSPVPVTANTTYVVSYHTQSGYYSADPDYFATAGFDNGPLRAMRDGEDGPNGVYRYGTPGFPTQSYRSSNYWVDVVFVTTSGSDTRAPLVTSVSPASGASGVPVTSPVTAVFDEDMDPASITASTFQLTGPSGAVAASVSYSGGTRTATLQPSSALATSAVYTATVRGGSSGVKDTAGNPLANDMVWSFTTAAPAPPPPDEGPGGPVLVVASASNPFTRYYAEILRNEGLNTFRVADISTITASTLASYDLVILGEMPLTDAQVTVFSNWVNEGGNLVAMRPDKKLASLLGLADAGSTLAEGYLLVNTAAAPGRGIVNQTVQFHGTADRYTSSGATVVATLYSTATSATTNPAVTLRAVGSSGGQAAAFTYDLARSVVFTRQGNPAWSGMERDGISPIRSNDLFYGGSVSDWIDRSKVAIPQADEQQRLLINLIELMTRDRKPLPRFWYLPRGLKAAVVMTGDDHANNGTAGRFDAFLAQSPSGCSVADWECIRGTSYIYPNTPISATLASQYAAAGFEIGVHVNTLCSDYTPQSLRSYYTGDLNAFRTAFPALPPPRTNRTHCIAWSDYATQPQVALEHGIRFDTNYYYWPPAWVADTPGLFTGSGMPMRFARADGTMIDVYQATTQLTDESGQSYPAHIDALLDRALGADGFYAVVTANMHTDTAAHAGADAIVASARSRGVPVVSAEQMLTWLDGRNGSSFGNLTWSAGTLGFSVAVGSGAGGLQALLPTMSASGQLTAITRSGANVPFATDTIKGVTYARFAAEAGSYTARYDSAGSDTTAPVITSITAEPAATTATIRWTTDEPATSEVRYGLQATTLSSSVSATALATSHALQLAGLTPGTQYYFQVRSSDAAGNAATAPASPATFTTSSSPPSQSLTDTTAADFAAGTRSGTYVAATGDGELTLAPAEGAEFAGATLPLGWGSVLWTAGGSATVSGGRLTVDGSRVDTNTLFASGNAVEFSAVFGSSAYQHAGFGDTLSAAPWAIFSTGSGGALWARTHDGTTATDTPITGSWLGSAHRYRIEWSASSIRFLIDGAVVATHAVAIASGMRAVASDYNAGGDVLTIDWMRVLPYASSGTFVSRVFDAGAVTSWTSASWTASTPGGTSMNVGVRFGNTEVPDGTWTTFTTVASSGAAVSGSSRYAQYQVALASTSPFDSSSLEQFVFSASSTPAVPSISIGDLQVAEGHLATTTATVTVTLSAAAATTVTVNYATTNGSASAGSDYTAASGTLSFAAGTTAATIPVQILGDTIVEPDEQLYLDLTSPTNATIADSRGVVTIVNDDTAAAMPAISIQDVSVTERNSGTRNVTFTVRLSEASTQQITVAYATADGTARAGSDYVAGTGTLTFNPGVTVRTFSVAIVGDRVKEGTEAFFANLSNAVNATLADAQGVCTIIDND